MNFYSTRKKCIFCSNELKNSLFENDLQNYVAHYAVDKYNKTADLIPYNVLICDHCNTPQIKYLGNLDEIYKINHADGTGSTMKQMHEKKLELVLKYKDTINGIIEIGSSKGILSDHILENVDIDYYIIEPSYFGNHEKKVVISDYYENVEDKKINANTIIMSHVFEHFYEPLEILKKIEKNDNIENIFLTFPNFEKYIEEGIHHVLNTEHTFYVDNEFIEKLFSMHGFELVEINFYKSHSALFYFKRNYKLKELDIKLKNKIDNINLYFEKIHEIVNYFNNIIEINNNKNIYIFPASCHSAFLTIFGLKYKQITGMVDNSVNKIGKKMYGLDLEIFSFNEMIKNEKDSIFLINGGVFNSEIEETLKINNINYYKS